MGTTTKLHWFLLWPTKTRCPEKDHSGWCFEKYDARLYVHRTHSLYYTCSSEAPYENAFINTIIYLGRFPSHTMLEISITKGHDTIPYNILTPDTDKNEQMQCIVLIEPVSFLNVLSDTFPQTSMNISLIQSYIHQPPFIFLLGTPN